MGTILGLLLCPNAFSEDSLKNSVQYLRFHVIWDDYLLIGHAWNFLLEVSHSMSQWKKSMSQRTRLADWPKARRKVNEPSRILNFAGWTPLASHFEKSWETERVLKVAFIFMIRIFQQITQQKVHKQVWTFL